MSLAFSESELLLNSFLQFRMESYSTKFKTAFLCISREKKMSDFWKAAFYMMIWRMEVLVTETGYYDHCTHSTLRWDGLNRCDGIGIENNKWSWNVHHRNSGQTFVTWYQKSWGRGSRQCQVITLNFSAHIHLYCY